MKIDSGNNKKIGALKNNFKDIYKNFVDVIVYRYTVENPTKSNGEVESVKTLLLNNFGLFLELTKKLKDIDAISLDDKKIPASINFNIEKIENLEKLIITDESSTAIAKDTKGFLSFFSTIEIKQDPELIELFKILKETREKHSKLKYNIESFENELSKVKNNGQICSILTRITQWYNNHRDEITNITEIFKKLLEISEYFTVKIN